MDVLTLDQVNSYYGKHRVLRRVSFSAPARSVTLLLGRNGMGKTTSLRTIMNFTPARNGTIRFNDRDISRMPTHMIARAGIGYVPEGRQIFPHLTVAENLRTAELTRRSSRNWTLDKIFEHFPILRERADQPGRSLSGGEQQQLAVARALAGAPELLILDEPSQGLAPKLVTELTAMLLRLKEEGLAILLVEQNIQMARKIGDHMVVLSKGEAVFEASAEMFNQKASEIEGRYLSV